MKKNRGGKVELWIFSNPVYIMWDAGVWGRCLLKAAMDLYKVALREGGEYLKYNEVLEEKQ